MKLLDLFRYLPLLLLISCSFPQEKPFGGKKREQTLRFNLHSELSSLDPRMVNDLPARTSAFIFFDGLFRFDPAGKVQASIANKYTLSPDQKTYTFWLKESNWSNGLPVTAYDFEAAWKKILSPSFPAEFAHLLFPIKNAREAKLGEKPLTDVGVHAEGKDKLIVELASPNPFFLHLTATPICLPTSLETEMLDPKWAQKQGNEFVCNGPFSLARWRCGSELIAEKNLSYWDAQNVRLEKLIITMIEDEHTEFNMYENGELDWAGSPNSSIPPEALPALRAKGLEEKELFIMPLAGTYCYKFNTKKPPFDNPKMRKAFAYAINRQSLIDNILQANQQAAFSLVPPWMKEEGSRKSFFDKECQKRALALFEEALEENGWTRETLPEITLSFSRSEKHHKTAQAVQQQWMSAFGINIHLQTYEWNTFIDYLSKLNYQIGGRSWISHLPDPKTLLENYCYTNDSPLGGNNDTGWENGNFRELIEKASGDADPAIRSKLLSAAEAILLDEMPIAPVYHSTACYLKKPYVKGVSITRLCDLDFKYAYIQDE